MFVCVSSDDEMCLCVRQAGDESSEEEEGEVDSEVEFPRRCGCFKSSLLE